MLRFWPGHGWFSVLDKRDTTYTPQSTEYRERERERETVTSATAKSERDVLWAVGGGSKDWWKEQWRPVVAED